MRTSFSLDTQNRRVLRLKAIYIHVALSTVSYYTIVINFIVFNYFQEKHLLT